jgi:rod shape determining protein RodA
LAQHVLDRRAVLDRRSSTGTQLLQHVDVVLVFSTLAMAVLGVVMVYSATRAKLVAAGIDPHYYLKRQAVFAVIGLAVMLVVTLIDYHRLEEWSVFIYGAIVFGLLVVLSPFGHHALGAQRWFSLGAFQLQPSAFASLALIVAAAVYCSRHQGQLDLRRIGVLLLMAGIPIILVIKQPDLGTGIIMTVILITVLVVSGARLRYLLLLGVLAAVALFLVVHLGFLQRYQVDRLTGFLHQNQTTGQSQASSYNLEQSKIAIAAGGVHGRGLFHGSQTNLAYVPEQQTDFIFTAVGEQLGFIGTASVLALFGLLVWRILRAAQLARDQLGRLLCTGAFALIAFSVFQNAGMTMGIMPITGIPLPFMSYGGSATIAFFAAVGLVLNVGMRRFR